MKNHNKGKIIITSLITLAPMLIGLFYWNKLPNQIATHFGTGNVSNGWSSKIWAVVGLPVLLMALHLFCIFVILNDPKKKNIGKNMLGIVYWIIPVTSIIVNSSIYGVALGMKLNVEVITMGIVGMLFLVLGNYMSKNHQNYTVGIRNPWTLSSEENWEKTHRLASKMWMIGGIIVLLNIFFKQPWILIAVVLICAFVPMGYSYMLYAKGK